MSSSPETMVRPMYIREIDYRNDPVAHEAALLIFRTVLYAMDPGENPAGAYNHVAGRFYNYCAVESATENLLGVAALQISRRSNRVGFLENVAVVPGSREQGVGRQLVAHIEQEAMQKDVEFLQVQSLHTAVGFYKKLGYQPSNRQIPDLLVKQLII